MLRLSASANNDKKLIKLPFHSVIWILNCIFRQQNLSTYLLNNTKMHAKIVI